jgi:hypothetical protein
MTCVDCHGDLYFVGKACTSQASLASGLVPSLEKAASLSRFILLTCKLPFKFTVVGDKNGMHGIRVKETTKLRHD